MELNAEAGEPVSLETADYLREYFGIDKPMFVRYLKWVWNLVRGDFGISMLGESGERMTGDTIRPVWGLVSERLLLTVLLGGVHGHRYPALRPHGGLGRPAHQALVAKGLSDHRDHDIRTVGR